MTGGTISSGTCLTADVTGRYWISSKTGVRHGRHPRRDRHVGEEVPQARQGASAAGIDGRLDGRRVQQRVIARGERVDQVGQHEADALGVGFVEARLGDDALGGLRRGQVGLHRAVQQRVARPARVGEPAVPAGRLHLRAAGRDAAEFAEQLAAAPGDQPWPGRQRGRQAQAGAARIHPAQHARGRVGQQQVQRRRGVGRGWPGRIGVAHDEPSVGRGARSSIGRRSRTGGRASFHGHRRGPRGWRRRATAGTTARDAAQTRGNM